MHISDDGDEEPQVPGSTSHHSWPTLSPAGEHLRFQPLHRKWSISPSADSWAHFQAAPCLFYAYCQAWEHRHLCETCVLFTCSVLCSFNLHCEAWWWLHHVYRHYMNLSPACFTRSVLPWRLEHSFIYDLTNIILIKSISVVPTRCGKVRGWKVQWRWSETRNTRDNKVRGYI